MAGDWQLETLKMREKVKIKFDLQPNLIYIFSLNFVLTHNYKLIYLIFVTYFSILILFLLNNRSPTKSYENK